MIDTLDIALRLSAGLAFGALIGFERQWRARTAGLRTNALVSLGSALFVIMGAFSFHGPDADPTRVAAQIVSGIGFLGAGVIMKQGASISGLNTAATLWASAAVGALAGGGLVWIGAAGTAAVILANVLLRPVGRVLDRRGGTAGREKNTEVEYTFEVRCAREHEVDVRAVVFDAVHRPELTVQSVAAADLPDEIVVITAIAISPERDDHQIELAIADVIRTPEVLGVRWTAQDLSPVD
ncbi:MULTISPECIES: MgtC/SapB family protein [unclassified Microbacterium]|jgi:putative Mg2+ transporter-C (MgtC) family protein|uniref:MgtC/SapB family protein n=1 Tax=unclassified Microbacterium TaxID=2609290 RepID=UPI001E44D484|nr:MULTISPECIES: MgtC/SapB family protein [unclassified Microbacterium]MCE4025296.1 MgtC/SapB family protein [Microbacterium sp. Au-Mic1]MDR2321848.1 MgtC/SapB family protein [Microbacterium sp.]